MARFEVILPAAPPEQPHEVRFRCELDGDRLLVVDAEGREHRFDPVAAAAAPAPRPPLRSADEQAREDALADLFVRAPRALDAQGEPALALAAVLDLAREKVSCDAAIAWRAGAREGVLEQAAVRGAAHPGPATLPFGTGIAGFCAQEGVCLAATDPAPASAGRAVLCAPMALGNRVLGVLELSRRRGDPKGGFGEGDLAVLAYLAHQAARWLGANG
jgi:hypothetical protein